MVVENVGYQNEQNATIMRKRNRGKVELTEQMSLHHGKKDKNNKGHRTKPSLAVEKLDILKFRPQSVTMHCVC